MLNGTQIAKLKPLILEHFSVSLEMVVYEKLNKPLDQFATGTNQEIVVFRMLQKLNQEQVDLLIVGLKDRTQDVDVHQKLDEAIRVELPAGVKPDQLCDTLLLSDQPPNPFINRQKWREVLKEVVDLSKDYRAISLTGDAASGKSFSWHLLEKVAHSAGFRPLKIDLKEPGWTLIGVCDTINEFLMLSRAEMRQYTLSDSPTSERIAHKFSSWLSLHMNELQVVSWIVFDGLKNGGGGTEVQQLLVPALLKKAEENQLRNLKIFLLGDRADRGGDMYLWTKHEDVKGLSKSDIEQYLINYAQKEKQRQLRPDEVASMVERITGGASWPFDHPTMRRITMETRKILKEVLV